MPPTQTTEDYIKTIYKLQVEGGKVATSTLAQSMGLSDPSITDMVKKLSEKGYVRYAPYQGVALTPSGRRMAMKTLRRHRLWEMFLVKFLGFSWDQIHDEAERLEHVTSDLLESKLDEALGFPAVDPHGDPIPTVDGELGHHEYSALKEHEAGAMVRVLRVSDEEPRILQHATRLGLGLHTTITIQEKMPFDGSMTILVGKKQQFISREVAAAIFVEEVE